MPQTQGRERRLLVNQVKMEDIISLCKRRGFIYQGSDVYGGLSGTWDYGPLGVQLKRNIMQLWWRRFVDERDDMYGVDAAILMNQKVWQASGHVDTFVDPLCEDTVNHRRYRTDHILKDNGIDADGMTMEQMDAVIAERGIKSPDGNPLSQSRTFNMMFKTQVGATESDDSISYLRPETAQGIFTNFKNVVDSFYPNLPFGIAQQGKAFRNEIAPRDFVFRSREFEQMEIEYFVRADPEKAMEIYNQWKADCMHYWTEVIGISPEHLRFKDHEKLAHYAAAAVDIEYLYPRGFGEIQGIHNRTNFDLSQHQEFSKKDMQYSDPYTGERYIPRCVEASFGLGRQVMVTMLEFYDEETLEDGSSRVVIRFPKQLAPVKFAILPLVKKDQKQVETAEKIFRDLSKSFKCEYDDGGAIGKRYRRQDEI